MAKALGMSRDELANMIALREIDKGISDEALYTMTGMTREQYLALGITKEWQLAVQKLAQSFMPLLKWLTKVIDGMAKAIS